MVFRGGPERSGAVSYAHDVVPGENLDDLAIRYLGNSSYVISIALATHAHTPPATPQSYQEWFNQQYYSSYGQSLISEFPWTGLGYTFDWASGPSKQTPFVRFGESEFVIHAGAPIEILEILSTTHYCEPGNR
jgi:hypothetical protein